MFTAMAENFRLTLYRSRKAVHFHRRDYSVVPSCCSLGTAANYPSVPVRRSSSDGGGAGVKSGILLTHGSRSSSSSSSLMPVNVWSHITRFSTTTSTAVPTCSRDLWKLPVTAANAALCVASTEVRGCVNNLPGIVK